MTASPVDSSNLKRAGENVPGAQESHSRSLIDGVVSLIIAVILVRAFAVEGYMISTGSMAPTLPGFHKRATCPACRYEFAVGLTERTHSGSEDRERSTNAPSRAEGAPGESIVSPSASREAVLPAGARAICPNCGFPSIDLRRLPATQGDQLLVHKHAYQFRQPRRWEVVVFRNPAEPAQAYVKRVVGLPGETVELIDGDVWINGTLRRKNLQRQDAVKILVYDHDYEPRNDKKWKPRWVIDSAGRWSRDGQSFVAQPVADSDDDPESAPETRPAWVTYRHWIRSGGRHKTSVAIPAALQTLDFSFPSLYPIRHAAEAQELWHRGVLPDKDRKRIAATFEDRRFRRLIDELAERSHLAPIADEYGYNTVRNGQRPAVVRDVMVTGTLSISGRRGRFLLEMTDGRGRYRLSIDVKTRIIALQTMTHSDGDHAGESAKPVRRAQLKTEVLQKPMRFVMSLFDRQVLVAINGHPVFKPLLLERLAQETAAPRHPVRVGAVDLPARVSHLKLYRDIYYTKKSAQRQYQLRDNEFFVLGDNSPISADSRVWADSGVRGHLFLGKPFLVHLPSRPGRWQVGGYEMRVRIPDVSRIRYIR